MLGKEAYRDMETIKATAQVVWGENCVFGEFRKIESPYPQFEWNLRLYNRFNIRLSYDRSTVDIEVPIKEEYVTLGRVTEEHVFWGFDGMKSDNLLHNFQVLDRLLKKQRT